MFQVLSISKSKRKHTVCINLNMSEVNCHREQDHLFSAKGFSRSFKFIQGPLVTTRASVLLLFAHLICGAANATQVSISGLLVRSPEGQVVSQKLHDQSRILVGVFCHIVKLCNGVLKGCASHFASFIRIIQHLIHEH